MSSIPPIGIAHAHSPVSILKAQAIGGTLSRTDRSTPLLDPEPTLAPGSGTPGEPRSMASTLPGARALLRLTAATAEREPSAGGVGGGESSARLQIAEQTCRARTRLLAAASHDLRQPLQAIGLWIELLREKVEGAELRSILGKIQDTARGAERVLDSLLDITKLDLGVVSVNVIDFAVADLLDHIASTFAPMARDHRLALRVHMSKAIARSDPVLLERILFNFVSNAIRYSKRGGVLVGCRRRRACLCCEVWDTGPGIRQDGLESIFEEFVQLEPKGRNRSAGALGLGLSIAQRTAALLGHPIQVKSCLGNGSCFRVDVPLGTQPAQATAALGDDDSQAAICGAFVVIVEDEQEQREAAASLLRNWGCHVVAASSAAEAIDRLGDHLRLPNLLLVDYRLQDHQTGAAAIRAIRCALADDTPALILTGDCPEAADAPPGSPSARNSRCRAGQYAARPAPGPGRPPGSSAGTVARCSGRIGSCRDTNRALAAPELRARYAKLGLEPTGGTQAELAALMKRDSERWAPSSGPRVQGRLMGNTFEAPAAGSCVAVACGAAGRWQEFTYAVTIQPSSGSTCAGRP